MGYSGFSRPLLTKALSSSYGKIQSLLLAFPGKRGDVSADLVEERYGSIFKSFNDRVTFIVMGHFGDQPKAVAASLEAFRATMSSHDVDPEHHLLFCHTPLAGTKSSKEGDRHSDFVQDPIIVKESEYGWPVILEPMLQLNPENSTLAEQLGAYGGYLLQSTDLRLEGGNILIGDDYGLVGKNVLHSNWELGKQMEPESPERWVTNRLRNVLGVRYIIFVGTEEKLDFGHFHSAGPEQHQPFFHLDYMACLAGRTRDGQEQVLLAKVNPAKVSECRPDEETMIAKINQAMEKVKDHLELSGTKIPGPRFKVTWIEIGGTVIQVKDGRKFIPYSLLNAHVEAYAGMRRLYAPEFPSIKSLQDDMEETLLYDGFTSVSFINGNFENLARRQGSLHCISNVFARSPYHI